MQGGGEEVGAVSVTLFIQHLLLSDPYTEMRIDLGRDYSWLIAVREEKSNKNKSKKERSRVWEKQAGEKQTKKSRTCFKMFLSQYSAILKSEK